MADQINTSLPWLDGSCLNCNSAGNQQPSSKLLLLLGILLISLLYFLCHKKTYDDHLPVVNRLFAREPHFVSRLRWAVRARNILDKAHEKVSALKYPFDCFTVLTLPISMEKSPTGLPEVILMSLFYRPTTSQS